MLDNSYNRSELIESINTLSVMDRAVVSQQIVSQFANIDIFTSWTVAAIVQFVLAINNVNTFKYFCENEESYYMQLFYLIHVYWTLDLAADHELSTDC